MAGRLLVVIGVALLPALLVACEGAKPPAVAPRSDAHAQANLPAPSPSASPSAFTPTLTQHTSAGRPPGTTVPRLTAQPQCRSFAETARTVCNEFLTFWERDGGLPRYGLPISDPFYEVSAKDGATHFAQYFERSYIEL